LQEAALDHALKGTSIRSCVQSTGPSLGGDAFTSCGETFEAEVRTRLRCCANMTSRFLNPSLQKFSLQLAAMAEEFNHWTSLRDI
jgi:hypothetical protein